MKLAVLYRMQTEYFDHENDRKIVLTYSNEEFEEAFGSFTPPQKLDWWKYSSRRGYIVYRDKIHD